MSDLLLEYLDVTDPKDISHAAFEEFVRGSTVDVPEGTDDLPTRERSIESVHVAPEPTAHQHRSGENSLYGFGAQSANPLPRI